MEGKVEAGVWQVWGEKDDVSSVGKPRFLWVETLSSILLGFMFPLRVKTSKISKWELICYCIWFALGGKLTPPNSWNQIAEWWLP